MLTSLSNVERKHSCVFEINKNQRADEHKHFQIYAAVPLGEAPNEALSFAAF